MRARLVLRGLVTLRAHRVAFGAQFLAVRIVAVGAGHALGEHPALQERAVVEDLVLHLAVDAVEAGLEQRQPEAVGEGLAGMDVVGHLRAPGMAARAGLDLGDLARGRRRHARPRRRIGAPGDAAASRKARGRPRPGIAARRALARPGKVGAARAMAGLAADAELAPGRLVVAWWRRRNSCADW